MKKVFALILTLCLLLQVTALAGTPCGVYGNATDNAKVKKSCCCEGKECKCKDMQAEKQSPKSSHSCCTAKSLPVSENTPDRISSPVFSTHVSLSDFATSHDFYSSPCFEIRLLGTISSGPPRYSTAFIHLRI